MSKKPSYEELVKRVKELEETLHKKSSETRVEAEVKDKDGNIRPVIYTKDVFHDENGNIAGLLGAFPDINDRRHAKEEVLANRHFLNNVLDSIQEGISVLDTDLNIIKANRWMEQRYIRKIPLAGQKCYRFYQERNSPCPWCPTLQTIQTGEAHTEIVPYSSNEGPASWIELTAYPLKDEYGNVVNVINYVKDITASKRMEKELRKANDIINRSPFVAFVWENASGWPVNYVTENVNELFGHSAQDFMTGKIFYTQTVHPDDIDRVANEVRRFSQEGNQSDFTHEPYRIVTKNGEVKWIYDIKHIQRDTSGTVTHYEGIIFDITSQKEAEQQLQDSEQLLSSIVESMQEGVLVLNRQFEYTHWNRSMEKASGISRTEVLGTIPWEKFLFLKGNIEKAMRNAMNGEVSHDIELQFRLPDGKEGWTSENYFPLIGPNETIMGVVGVIEDITLQKMAAKALEESKNLISNIINSMPSALVGVDIDEKVTLWNKTVEQTTGIKAMEAQGKRLSELAPGMISETSRIFESIQTAQIVQEQKRMRVLEDGNCYEDVTIYPLISNGVEGAVIRVDDVTERVRMEEMMIQSEKIMSVGGLAAGMAHEINNPLAGMIQTAKVMKSRLEDLEMRANLIAADEIGVSMDQVRAFMEKRNILRMVDTINESGRRVAKIVDNMLSFARKSDATVSTFHPAQLMDKVLELASTDYDLKKQYDFKKIKIIKEYEEGLLSIRCEEAKIQQVLLNIFRNGAQAMQSQNMDNDYTPCFVLRLIREESMLRIEIEDNGPGMEKEIQSRVFEPFFTTKHPGVGTGLGLSVSYFIITQNHGGTMDVISSLGKGSNFIIRLPLS